MLSTNKKKYIIYQYTIKYNKNTKVNQFPNKITKPIDYNMFYMSNNEKL